jgi:flagellar basal-body rod modification protein FlgD
MMNINLQEDLARLGLTNRQTAERTENELGQEDFMTLMIAQFRNQDPFEPMDNGEFLGQLAQFGAVDGIDRLNTSFSGLRDSIYSDQALQAANLVGHEVLARSDTAYLPESGNLSGAIELAASAQNVQVDILGPAGQLVQRLELGEQPPGLVRFDWNGLSDELEEAPAGDYRIEARVIRGSSIEGVETLVNARVDSVSLGGPAGLTLNVAGGQTLTMNQIRRIL